MRTSSLAKEFLLAEKRGLVDTLRTQIYAIFFWILSSSWLTKFFLTSSKSPLIRKKHYCVSMKTNSTYIEPWIVMLRASIVKPTRCTSVSNLFYFGITLYMFRTVFLSIIRSSRLYIQQQAFIKQILLSACWGVPASKQAAVSVWQMPVAVCTVLNSWWWTERPSETCRVSFQNKTNLIHWCILLIIL